MYLVTHKYTNISMRMMFRPFAHARFPIRSYIQDNTLAYRYVCRELAMCVNEYLSYNMTLDCKHTPRNMMLGSIYTPVAEQVASIKPE